MSTRSKRTLSAAAVIAALSAPSAAHARFNLNPTSPGATGPALHVHAADVSACPRGVACVSVDTMLTQGITNGEAAALGYNVGATHGLTYGEKEAAALGFGGTIAQTTGSSAGASGRRRHARGSTEASSSQPFEWGDAGIGAGVMFLLLSAGAATAVVGQRRRHRATTG